MKSLPVMVMVKDGLPSKISVGWTDVIFGVGLMTLRNSSFEARS